MVDVRPELAEEKIVETYIDSFMFKMAAVGAVLLVEAKPGYPIKTVMTRGSFQKPPPYATALLRKEVAGIPAGSYVAVTLAGYDRIGRPLYDIECAAGKASKVHFLDLSDFCL
jgi:hypothetical protein